MNKRFYNCLSSAFLILLSALPLAPLAEETPAVPQMANLPPPAQVPTPEQDSFSAALELLNETSFSQKRDAVNQLETLDDARVLPLLKSYLNSRLFILQQEGQAPRFVLAEETGQGYAITDAVEEKALGTVAKEALKKVSLNNSLRKQLRGAIARLSLSSKIPATRLAAVREMQSDMSDETVALLREALARESDSETAQEMQIAIAIVDINSDDKQTRITVIKTLGQSLNIEARNLLAGVLKKDESGKFLETDLEIRQSAANALNTINSRLDFYSLLQTIFFGVSLGSVLLLAAIGLAITFGVMGVINMAHGELMMLGAYTAYVIQQLLPNHIEYSLIIAIPAAFVVAGLVGIAIERSVIRFLYGRPLETLLATFGISLLLQQLVRSVFSLLNRAVETPVWMSGAMEINSALSLTYNRLYIVIFSLLVFFALLLVLKKTALGLQVRAVSQNRAMAKAMGVKTEWVDALTFGLGSGIAGVAGVALSQLTNVGPNLGQSYIIDSFMVVVFGGVGNLWGTLVGAMSLGVVNKFLEPWSGAVLAKILVLIFIILFIQKKPRGLFPQKGRAAEH